MVLGDQNIQEGQSAVLLDFHYKLDVFSFSFFFFSSLLPEEAHVGETLQLNISFLIVVCVNRLKEELYLIPIMYIAECIVILLKVLFNNF